MVMVVVGVFVLIEEDRATVFTSSFWLALLTQPAFRESALRGDFVDTFQFCSVHCLLCSLYQQL